MQVQGQVAVVGLMEWLQVLELNRRTVLFHLRRGGRSGWLKLFKGRILGARCGTTVGDPAALELLTWLDAHFEQESAPPTSPTAADGGEGVSSSNYDLMLRVMPRMPTPPAPHERWRVEGELSAFSLPELMQLAELNRRCWTLELVDCGGEVLFAEGRVVRASFDGARDADAIYALLAQAEGRFVARPLPQSTIPTDSAFDGNIQELLVEGVRRADEERLLRGQPIPEPDPTEEQLLEELDRGALPPTVRLAMAKRFQPRGEATPVSVLLRLAEDDDDEVRRTALESIVCLPTGIRQAILTDPDTPTTVRKLLAQRTEPTPTDEELPPDEDYPRGIHGRIRTLSLADKLYLARRGTRNERLILMRHPSKRVALAALESSRTTESDIEVIARSTSANVEVLSAIARDPRYNHKYSIVRSLVFNPKTPTQEAVKLVIRLRERDLLLAGRDPDLPEPVRQAVRKRLRALEVKRRF